MATGQVYSRLLKYIWPYKLSFVLSILGFAMFAASAPMLAHLMGVVENTLRDPSDDNIRLLILALLSVYLFRGVGTFLGKYFTAKVGSGVVYSLRTLLFKRMLRLPGYYYDEESSGRLISRVIFDVEQVNGASTRALTTLVQEGLTVILLMSYLIWLDPTLTLVFLVVVPVVGALVGLASRFFRRYSKRIQNSMGDVTQVTNESINGYKEVRTYGAIPHEENKFIKASANNRRQVMKFSLTNAINVPLSQQVIALGLGAMIYLMFQRVAQGNMTAEEFLQFITAASLIAKPIRALADVNAVIQKGVVAAVSVFRVLDAETEVDTGTYEPEKCDGQVRFQNVRFRYDQVESDALKGINLDIEAGSSVALVGKSGSGKSTLVNLLPRFYELSEGDVLIDGQSISSFKLDALRQQVAIVSQQVTLFNGTLYDNIAYGALKNATAEEVLAAAKAAHADEFIDNMPEGMDTHIGENGVMLSGGQRQRIAIARAILKNAPILILDEATSALDTESERHIQAAMEEVMKGRTTLVIAHRLSTIEHVDNIVVMNQGEIIEQGTHTELLAKEGAYAQLHKLQFSDLG